MVGLPISLKDYQIRAITAGKDALGKQPLRLNTTVACTMVVVSAPISLKSGVNAYINAVNSVFLAMELEQQEEE